MITLPSVLLLVHLVGLALGVGAGTVKLILLLKGRSDYGFLPTYFRVSKAITRTIITGVVLLTLSGAAWVFLGYELTRLLVVKLVLVAGIWVLGIYIDTAVEPQLQKLLPSPGEAPSPTFRRIQKRHLMIELLADASFYLIMIIWVLR